MSGILSAILRRAAIPAVVCGGLAGCASPEQPRETLAGSALAAQSAAGANDMGAAAAHYGSMIKSLGGENAGKPLHHDYMMSLWLGGQHDRAADAAQAMRNMGLTDDYADTILALSEIRKRNVGNALMLARGVERSASANDHLKSAARAIILYADDSSDRRNEFGKILSDASPYAFGMMLKIWNHDEEAKPYLAAAIEDIKTQVYYSELTPQQLLEFAGFAANLGNPEATISLYARAEYEADMNPEIVDRASGNLQALLNGDLIRIRTPGLIELLGKQIGDLSKNVSYRDRTPDDMTLFFLQTAYFLAPSNPVNARALAGYIGESLDRPEDALKILDALDEAPATTYRTIEARARMTALAGRPEEAVEIMMTAAPLSMKETAALMAASDIALENKLHETALRITSRKVSGMNGLKTEDAGTPALYYNHARALIALNRTREAIAPLQALVDTGRQDPDFLALLIHMKTENGDASDQVLEDAQRMLGPYNRGTPYQHQVAGLVYAARGEHGRAAEQFETAISQLYQNRWDPASRPSAELLRDYGLTLSRTRGSEHTGKMYLKAALVEYSQQVPLSPREQAQMEDTVRIVRTQGLFAGRRPEL